METDKLTVLYVEDEELIRQLVAKFLSKHFDVITACDGCEALEIFKTQNTDFLVTDITMPKMNGIDLIKAVKEMKGDIPVFVTTAHADDYQEIDGVNEVYCKPVDCRLMIADMKQRLSAIQ